MKTGTAPRKGKPNRYKSSRGVRGLRDRYHKVEPKEEGHGIGTAALYLLGLSICLVAGLSFVNFLALPDLHLPASPIKLPSLRGGMHEMRSDSSGLQGITPATKAPIDSPLSGQARATASSPFSNMYEQGAVVSTIASDPQSPLPARSASVATLNVQRAPEPVPQVAQAPQARAAVAAVGKGDPVHSSPPSASSVSKKVAGGGGIAVLEGDTWFKLYKNVDAKEITFGAWIFLPNPPMSAFPQSSQSMKTIAATKISGCKVDTQGLSDGWALFVHEWGTYNQQLRLSWTDSRLACNELYSETAVVPFDRWVHVGFTLSETQNSARLLIDGKVIADTSKMMGSLAKASQRVSLSEANVRDRKVAVSGANSYMLYGAHLPQGNDQPHVQSHVFFGFLGDMRLLHLAPEDPEQLKQMLTATAEELLSQSVVSASAIAVQTSFKVSNDPQVQSQNLADGQPITRDPATGFDRPEQVVTFSDQPKHPYFKSMSSRPIGGYDGGSIAMLGGYAQAGAGPPEDIAPAEPLLPAATLAPEVLQASWPQEWKDKHGEAVLLESQRKADVVADGVRAAMVHTWRGYRSKAWGHDDLKPVSGHSKDWCRMGITILDALTTLWLMDLKDEFAQATQWLKDNPVPSRGNHGMHSVFEMSIRGLGGLLGAYGLSGEQIFLDNAKSVANALLKAFNTPSGMPKSQVDVGSGRSEWHKWVHFAVLAEVATVQVEMRYLSHVVGDDTYKRAADKAFEAVLQASGDRGLIPIYLTQQDEVPRFGNQKISLGAMGDSYYEYLIKQWVQNGKKDDRLKNKWKLAMSEMLDQLVRKTMGGLTYVCEKDRNQLRHRMDHLACFVAGMLMMGARELPPDEVDPRYEPTAAALTETCHEMYKRTPSGLSPEYVVFHPDRMAPQDMTIPNDAPHNLLRPEAAEAMYYMHYYTGDPKYREWAHEMFQAFERNSKARYGYAAVRDVRQSKPMQRDDMESFWAAETLKYLYLIQAPRSKLSMETYVFNTEAHPMPRWVEN